MATPACFVSGAIRPDFIVDDLESRCSSSGFLRSRRISVLEPEVCQRLPVDKYLEIR